MKDINLIYNEMTYAVNHIKETAENLKKNGKKIIGVAPPFVPIELIYASGMFPFGCWGGQTSLSNSSTYLPSFACSIVQEMTELAVNGAYDCLDGIMISCACDTLKCTGQNLKKICPNTEIIFCRYPQHNKTNAARDFFIDELKSCKKALENISGHVITNEDLRKSIQLYNENRKEMQKFVKFLSEKPGLVSNKIRHDIIKSRFYMDIKHHTVLMEAINEELSKAARPKFNGCKAYMSGIMAEPDNLLNAFDELNISIVGDELIQESRQFQVLVPEGLDQLERLADQWANVSDCSFILDIGKKRAQYISNQAKELDADAIIFLQMMFCDIDEFDQPFIKKYANEKGIPFLSIEIQQNMQSVEQIRTRLQAFCEIIQGNK